MSDRTPERNWKQTGDPLMDAIDRMADDMRDQLVADAAEAEERIPIHEVEQFAADRANSATDPLQAPEDPACDRAIGRQARQADQETSSGMTEDEDRCSAPTDRRGRLGDGDACGGLFVFERMVYTTGPDTRWREQPVVLIDYRCRRCGAHQGRDRKPRGEDERDRCLDALRQSEIEIVARWRKNDPKKARAKKKNKPHAHR